MDDKIEVETSEALRDAGKTPEDIAFIGSRDGEYGCSWAQFEQLCIAGNEHYYSGYGGQTLATDLVIVFTDGTYLERAEYDGSEGWQYITPITIPETFKPISTICNGGSWVSVAEMNRIEAQS